MGMFKKNCTTAPVTVSAPAPNPDPTRWRLLDCHDFIGAHVLIVQYLDCTNYEGRKVMVYVGPYRKRRHLDPHFTFAPDSPIARFRPDDEGIAMADALAKYLAGRRG